MNKHPQRLDWAEQIANEKAEKVVNSLIKGRENQESPHPLH